MNGSKAEEVIQEALNLGQDKIQIAVNESESDKANVTEFVIDKDAVKKLADCSESRYLIYYR